MIKKFKENYLSYVCIILMSIFQIYWILQYKFYVQSDDFGYMANAAYFAGYSWNNYTGDMTPYYNIGFSYLPAIFFRMTLNPTIVYRLLLIYILGLQILSYIFVYKIFIKFLRQNKAAASIGALVYSVSIFSPQSGMYFMSEVPYAFTLLILIYFLLSSINATNAKRIVYSVTCGAVLAYSYSVHTRFLVSVVVVLLVLFLYALTYKKHILNRGAFILSFAVILVITYYWVKSVQNILYKPTDGLREVSQVTGNDAFTRFTYIPAYIKKFLNIESWKQFLLSFFSLMGTYTLLTGGFIWIVIISSINMLRKEVKQKSLGRNIFVLTLFGLISFLGMNCLVAANGVMAIAQTKWLTAIRYSRPYVGILFIVFFPILWGRHINKKELIGAAAGSLCSLLIVVQYVGPVYEKAAYLNVSAVGWMKYFFFYVYRNVKPMEYFLTATQISLLIGISLYLLLHSNRSKVALIILVGYSLSHTVSENQWNLINESEKNYKTVDGTIAFMERYRDEILVPLYFMQGSYAGKLRFGLFSDKMTYILNKEDLYDIDYSNAVLFSDRTDLYDVEGLDKPMACFEIDKNEYVYTSNMEIITALNMEYKSIDY